MRRLEDQTILISGATDGLGTLVAAELAAYGATLLLQGLDDREGADTARQIQRRTGNTRVHWYRADLSSLRETADLAGRIAGEHGQLDVLVNHLPPCLLTRKLLPVLLQSAPARVVNVACAGQAAIPLIMFTFDLADELAGSGVTVNCLRPAASVPAEMPDGQIQPHSSVQEGIRATMRLIVSPALERVSGRYFEGLEQAAASGQAWDENARHRLGELPGRLTGLVTSR
ncbi:MAG TPA: SDR family NAD(P)-dependent oxidoreductase [Streptosporangiaceae bacterium]|nr:SDR family NAD(P)-dependent oxidoreductase [Streptosporangiaceae bacterium]